MFSNWEKILCSALSALVSLLHWNKVSPNTIARKKKRITSYIFCTVIYSVHIFCENSGLEKTCGNYENQQNTSNW